MKNIGKSTKHQVLGFETSGLWSLKQSLSWRGRLRLTRVVSPCCPCWRRAEELPSVPALALDGPQLPSKVAPAASPPSRIIIFTLTHFSVWKKPKAEAPNHSNSPYFQLNMSEKHPKPFAKVISYQVPSQICRLKRVHESQISSQPFAA